MKRKNQLKRNILWMQLYYFFRSFIFAYVIERLFWRSRGIGIAETVYIEIIYGAVIILMEIPTGILADRFSRKHIILLGSVLTLIGSVAMLFAQGFWSFAGIITLSGISGALTSGSNSALLYDSLKELDQTHLFQKYLARIKGLRYGSGLIAALVGSWMASSFNLLMPYQWSVFSCLMMVVLNLLLVEPKKINVESSLTIKEIFLTTKEVVFRYDFIKFVMIVGSIIGASVVYIEEFWQNYMDGVSLPIVYFGLISGAMSMIVLIASKQTTKIVDYFNKHQSKRKKGYSGILIVSMICFTGLFIIRHPLGLILMLIPLYFEAVMDTLVLGDIHHNIDSEYRATIESVYSMLCSTMSVVFGLCFAFASSRSNVFTGFLSVSILGYIIIGIKIMYFKRKSI